MLKYRFQATYKDGSTYVQNDEDISITDPKRSSYFDVKQDELRSFFLYDEKNTFSVNLDDGHFEVNGIPFLMHEGHIKKVPDGIGGFKEVLVPLSGFRLIFFRRHTHSFIAGEQGHKEVSHDIVYRLGWQCTVDGKNYQEIMQFA